jgi:hypothetical protein
MSSRSSTPLVINSYTPPRRSFRAPLPAPLPAYFPVEEPNAPPILSYNSQPGGNNRLPRNSYSRFSAGTSLPPVDEDSEPPSPLSPPPVVLRAAQLQGEGSSIDEQSVTDLPANLGRLNSWLIENRRRSRVGGDDGSELGDDEVGSEWSMVT